MDLFLYSVTVLVWGSSWLAMTFQLGVVAPEVSVVYRFAIAAAVFMAVCLATRRRMLFSLRDHAFIALQGVFLFSSNFFLIYLGAQYLTSGLVSVGFSTIDVDRRIDQTVTTLPGFGGGQELFFPIAYDADSDFIDARLRYAVDERIAFGGDFRLYDNSGSFALEREDLRGWVEFGVGNGYLIHLGYRTVDYDEQAFNFDDYDADIAEVSFGYRW